MVKVPDSRPPSFPPSAQNLRSTHKCPYCFLPTAGAQRCLSCGLDLTLPQLTEVFHHSLAIADMCEQREGLLREAMRLSTPVAPPVVPAPDPVAQAPSPATAVSPGVPLASEAPAALSAPTAMPAASTPPTQAVPVSAAPTAQFPAAPASDTPSFAAPAASATPAFATSLPAPAPVTSPGPAVQFPAAPAQPAATAPRRPMTTPILLLGVGITFLAIAAIVFLTVAFSSFSLGSKAVITGGITLSTMGIASVLKFKQLRATAEGIAVLGGILLALDAWAIRALNFFDLANAPTGLYWGTALLILSGIAWAWARASYLRSPSLMSALALVPGATILITGLFSSNLNLPALVPLAVAALIGATALLGLRPPTNQTDSEGTPVASSRSLPAWTETAVIVATSHFAALSVMVTPWTSGPPLWPWVVVGQLCAVATLTLQISTFARHHEWASLLPLRYSGALISAALWVSGILFAAIQLEALWTWSTSAGAGLLLLGIALIDAAFAGYQRTLRILGATLVGIASSLSILSFGIAPTFGLLVARLADGESTIPNQSTIAWGLSLIVAAVLSTAVYWVVGDRTTAPEGISLLRRRGPALVSVGAVGAIVTAYGLPSLSSSIILSALAIVGVAIIRFTSTHQLLQPLHGEILLVGATLASTGVFGVGTLANLATLAGMTTITLMGVLLIGPHMRPAPISTIAATIGALALGLTITTLGVDNAHYQVLALTLTAVVFTLVPTLGVHRLSRTDAIILHTVALVYSIGAQVGAHGVMTSLGGPTPASKVIVATGISMIVTAATAVAAAFAVVRRWKNYPAVVGVYPVLHAATATTFAAALLLPWVRGGDTIWAELLSPSNILATSALAAALVAVGASRHTPSHRRWAAVTVEALVALGVMRFLVMLTLTTPHLINGIALLLFVTALVLLGAIQGRTLRSGPPAAWVGMGVLATLGPAFLDAALAAPWTLTIMAPTIAAFALAAIGFATRPASRTPGGSWVTALLTGTSLTVFYTALVNTSDTVEPATGHLLVYIAQAAAIFILAGTLLAASTLTRTLTDPPTGSTPRQRTPQSPYALPTLWASAFVSAMATTVITVRLLDTYLLAGQVGALLLSILAITLAVGTQIYAPLIVLITLTKVAHFAPQDRTPSHHDADHSEGVATPAPTPRLVNTTGITILSIMADILFVISARASIDTWSFDIALALNAGSIFGAGIALGLLARTVLTLRLSARVVTPQTATDHPTRTYSPLTVSIVSMGVLLALWIVGTTDSLAKFTTIADLSQSGPVGTTHALFTLIALGCAVGVYTLARQETDTPSSVVALTNLPLIAWSVLAAVPVLNILHSLGLTTTPPPATPPTMADNPFDGHWHALATTPWWQIITACIMLGSMAISAVVLRSRAGQWRRFIAATVSVLLPLVALNITSTRTLAAGVVFFVIAAAVNATLFAAPSAVSAIGISVGRALSMIGAVAATMLAASDMPAHWQPVITLPVALMSLLVGVSLRADSGSTTMDRTSAYLYVAAAPLLLVLSLAFPAGEHMRSPLWALTYAGTLGLLGIAAALWTTQRTREEEPEVVAALRHLPSVLTHLAAALAISAFFAERLALQSAPSTILVTGDAHGADLAVGVLLALTILAGLGIHLRGNRRAAGPVFFGYPAVFVVALGVTVASTAVLTCQPLEEPVSYAWITATELLLVSLAALGVLITNLGLPTLPAGVDVADHDAALQHAAGRAYLRSLMCAGIAAIATGYILLLHIANTYDLPGELLFTPLGVVMFVIGWRTAARQRTWSSWTIFAPSIVLLMLIPLIAQAFSPTGERIAVLTVVIVAMITVGARKGLQAPLVGGSIAGLLHAIIAVRTALPNLVVPWWVWLSIAGVILVALASTYEARMRDAQRLRAAIRSLR